ncbi:helix-turn-helix transcriptional regulator [Corticibacterium sp. UT-5YL-CI-8]|nr:helix-turn-helix transcriptional regulator [Tianweitania sp. UT-5YL-CI-8]
MDVFAKLAWNLRRLRTARGLSLDELAYQAEVERAYAGRLERGERNPTLRIVEKLADALECDITELLAEPVEGATKAPPLKPGRKPKNLKDRERIA